MIGVIVKSNWNTIVLIKNALFFCFFFVLVECIDCGACAFIVVCDLLNESAIV